MPELTTAKYLQDVQIEEAPNPLSPEITPVAPQNEVKRPGALAWLCTILGGLGLLSAMLTLPALLLSPTEFDTSQIQGEQAEVMLLVAENSMAISNQFRFFNIALSGAHLIVAGGLLIGGLMTLSRSKVGSQILVWSCVLAIGFEVTRFLLQGLQSYLQLNGVKDAMVTSTAVTTQMASNLETGIMIGLIVSLGFGFLFAAGKCFVYYLATDKLQRPEVQAGLG